MDEQNRKNGKKEYRSGQNRRPERKPDYKNRRRFDSPAKENAAEDEEFVSQLAVGRNAVLELLKSGRDVDKIYVKKDGERVGSINLIVGEAVGRGIPVVEIEGTKLDAMADGTPHQGVIASAAAKEYCSVEDILKIAEEKGEKPFIVIADGIEDPQNLGTLIRVCECAGVHGLILPKRRASGLTGAVTKSSAGAIEHVAVAKVVNLAQTVDMLKEKGVWIFAAEAGSDAYYDTDMNCPCAIVMGSEGFGVSHLLLEKSDYRVSIPMYGQVNSLNVSTAAAVIIHEAAKQRHKN